LHQALGDAQSVRLVVDALAQHRELVAAEARDRVGRAQGRAQARAERAQQLVTGVVAERALSTFRLSTSRKYSAIRRPSRSAPAIAARSRSSSSVRFGRPVSASCSASWRICSSTRSPSIAPWSTWATALRKFRSRPPKVRCVRLWAPSRPIGASGRPTSTVADETIPCSRSGRARQESSFGRSSMTTGPSAYLSRREGSA